MRDARRATPEPSSLYRTMRRIPVSRATGDEPAPDVIRGAGRRKGALHTHRCGSRIRPASPRRSRPLQRTDDGQGLVPRRATHPCLRSQRSTHGRPFGPTEDRARKIFAQLHARHARRLAVRHAGNRRGNRRRDATRAAGTAAIHGLPPVPGRRAQSAVCIAGARARRAACTGCVSGRRPCQRSKADAACSISMPRPSTACSAPPVRAHARKPAAASP